MSALHEYIANWDPMNFISEGAPRDEYNSEAEEIIRLFKHDMDEDQVGELIYRVFLDFMEIDPKGFKEDCYKRAGEIKDLLNDRLK